jgi:hypothetical protein
MLLGPDFSQLPWNASVSVASVDPPVFIIDNFISDYENAILIEAGGDFLKPSPVVGESLVDALQYRTR